MPQTNSTIPICNEQTSLAEIFTWSGIKNESPPEAKLISQKTDHIDEDFSSQVTESDSGFLTGSDEEDRLNSGLCSGEDFDLNILLQPGSVSDVKNSVDFLNCDSKKDNDTNRKYSEESSDKNSIFVYGDRDDQSTFYNDAIQDSGFALNKTTNVFDFWNNSNKKENDINNQCIKNLGNEDLSFIHNDHINRTSLSDEIGSSASLLNNSACENTLISDHKKSSTVNDFNVSIQKKQETVNDNNSDLNFYEFFNEINIEEDNKMVNTISHQNVPLSRKNNEAANFLTSDCFEVSNNMSPNFDNVYSDLVTSLSSGICCNDDSSISNCVANNDTKSNKLKSSYSFCSSENDESLSDLLASICVEDISKSENSCTKPHSDESELNSKACDIDLSEVSLASLAEKYLSSGCGGDNAKDKNSCIETLSNETVLKNKKADDIDANEISLASLAEEYLSSNNGSSSSLQDSLKLAKNNSLNFEISSETNINHLNEDPSQEAFDMCDLFASVNKEHQDTNTICLNDTTTDLLFQFDIYDTMSPNKNSVESFAEKYLHNAESSDDEIDGVMEIDLTSCLKSDKLPNSPSNCLKLADSKAVQETNYELSYRLYSPTKQVKSAREAYLPHAERKRTNIKQSLFAKALSCKPRRDKSAMLKVLSIKKQLCERLFNPSEQSFAVKPLKPIACPANDFIYSTLGRRIFEHGNFREVK